MQHFYHPILSVLRDTLELFYPRVCGGCSSHLTRHEHNLCLACKHGLPKTYFWDYDVNPVEELFWGRLKIDGACSFLHFEKGSIVQELMHRLKYKGKTGIGVELGSMFATVLMQKHRFADVDLIVPVPLHPSKQMRRGYNQSDFIAEGISLVLQVPYLPHALRRTVASESQTRKGRYDRSKNVEQVFEAEYPDRFKEKNILLIDDVLTTGATLEAAGSVILSNGARRLYLATLAVA